MKASLRQPALIGGLVSGLLSALPLIAGGNLCCCLWIVSGGVVAAFVLQQSQPEPIAPGDGALVGLLAGVAGAFVYLVVSIPINMMVAPMERRVFQRLVETMGNMPPEFRDYANSSLASGLGTGLRTLFGFVFMLMLGAIFSTIGGLLGALVFAKKAPRGVIDIPPAG